MQKSLDIKRIQSVELEILRITVDILEKNNIKSYLIGGTCLGAIRHKGFIPWDDDIDIGLFREDYEKARIVLMRDLPKGYLYIDNRTNPENPYNFGKVKKRGTAFVQVGDEHLNIHHGIYIDLFPIDDCANTIDKCVKEMKTIKRYRLAEDIANMNYYKGDVPRKFAQRCLIFLAHLLLNTKRIQDKIDKLCMRNMGQQSKLVCIFLGQYSTKDIFDRDVFGEGKFVEFENSVFRVPEKYDKYLSSIYGDYMILPPLDKRVAPHDILFSSFDSEYICKTDVKNRNLED